jgi:serine/threonine protein kinase
MEDLITINNDLISRFKIISYLNGFYNEIIFSSNNKIEMICFLNGIKKVINKNIIWEKYSKIKEIHNSNKSKIFLGKNLNNNKNVIIKIIEQNKIINNLIYENIIWEYTIMNYLVTNSHPNIIKVYDCYRDSNGFYYVMEYIKNGNLNNFLKEHQKKKI